MIFSLSALMAVATLFGLLAGAAAFVITYDEYFHHFPDRKKVLKASFAAGFVAFLFFWAGALLLFPLSMKIVATLVAG